MSTVSMASTLGPRKKISPYINDHGWSLLVDRSDLKSALDIRQFRQRAEAATGVGHGIEERSIVWQPIDNRDDVVFDRVLTSDNGQLIKADLRRMS